jgi:glycerophosphoryl diester phosphodiesterase
MRELADLGVNIIAPPLWMLLEETSTGGIAPSLYAKRAKRADLDIITWTLERSGRLADPDHGGWYLQTLNGSNSDYDGVIEKDGDIMEVLHVLARDVDIAGIFSDWPATVTYYANCLDPRNEGIGPNVGRHDHGRCRDKKRRKDRR